MTEAAEDLRLNSILKNLKTRKAIVAGNITKI